jgi:hypothetical protein
MTDWFAFRYIIELTPRMNGVLCNEFVWSSRQCPSPPAAVAPPYRGMHFCW